MYNCFGYDQDDVIDFFVAAKSICQIEVLDFSPRIVESILLFRILIFGQIILYFRRLLRNLPKGESPFVQLILMSILHTEKNIR